MNDLNVIFSKEFGKLRTEADKRSRDLFASIKNMQNIPEITDLDVCKQLEKAHFDIYINCISLSDTAHQLSQLYRYIYVINEDTLKSTENEAKL